MWTIWKNAGPVCRRNTLKENAPPGIQPGALRVYLLSQGMRKVPEEGDEGVGAVVVVGAVVGEEGQVNFPENPLPRHPRHSRLRDLLEGFTLRFLYSM